MKRDPEGVRIATTARFSKEDGLVLVSTDAPAEGLNLHHRCHYLLHLELPYNPNRLEQRNGRIDRYGQTKAPDVRYLYLSGTFEERLLLRLVAKYERQRARLTFVPNTLGLFDEHILEATKLVHDCSGLMYGDGANLNALLGIVRPAELGFDLMHFNLHKTFAVPHGGGGPGCGPVAPTVAFGALRKGLA